ncbi:MAG: protein kinase [bacterium]
MNALPPDIDVAAHPTAPSLLERLQLRLAERFGERYVYEKELGRGGFADVYLFRDTQGDQGLVAMKVCGLELDGELRARFLEERAISDDLWAAQAQITPRVWSLDSDADPAYLIMSFAPGERYDRWLQERTGLSFLKEDYTGLDPNVALPALLAIANAVASLHKCFIQHRDLKPGNMLLDQVDDEIGWRAVLLDFGVAKRPGSRETLYPRERPVTPEYAPPERLRSIARTHQSEDVYAYGVICYETLAGFLPWIDQVPLGEDAPEDESTQFLTIFREWGPETIRRRETESRSLRLHQPPTTIRQFNPAVSEELDRLVCRMLAVEPSQRPDIRDVVYAFRKALGLPEQSTGLTMMTAAVAPDILTAARNAVVAPTAPAVVAAKTGPRFGIAPILIILMLGIILGVVMSKAPLRQLASNRIEQQIAEAPIPVNILRNVMPRGAVGVTGEVVRFKVDLTRELTPDEVVQWRFTGGTDTPAANGRMPNVTLTTPGTYLGTVEVVGKNNQVASTSTFNIEVVAADATHADLIADPGLELALREALNADSGLLTLEQLAQVTSLKASGVGIGSLDGIARCKNLSVLNLGANRIVDLTPLNGLTDLEGLYLLNNRIVDPSPLSRLHKLRILDLASNLIVAVPPGTLNRLDSLETLTLDANPLTDLPDLSGLANLRTLNVRNCNLQRLPRLANMGKLTTFDLSNNNLQEISSVATLTGLQSLLLCGNPNLVSIDGVERLPELKTISMDKSQPSAVQRTLDLLTAKAQVKVLECIQGSTTSRVSQ